MWNVYFCFFIFLSVVCLFLKFMKMDFYQNKTTNFFLNIMCIFFFWSILFFTVSYFFFVAENLNRMFIYGILSMLYFLFSLFYDFSDDFKVFFVGLFFGLVIFTIDPSVGWLYFFVYLFFFSFCSFLSKKKYLIDEFVYMNGLIWGLISFFSSINSTWSDMFFCVLIYYYLFLIVVFMYMFVFYFDSYKQKLSIIFSNFVINMYSMLPFLVVCVIMFNSMTAVSMAGGFPMIHLLVPHLMEYSSQTYDCLLSYDLGSNAYASHSWFQYNSPSNALYSNIPIDRSELSEQDRILYDFRSELLDLSEKIDFDVAEVNQAPKYFMLLDDVSNGQGNVLSAKVVTQNHVVDCINDLGMNLNMDSIQEHYNSLRSLPGWNSSERMCSLVKYSPYFDSNYI